MKTNLSVLVRAEWDEDAAVWVATSDDVPGLVAEHADFGELQKMVIGLIPMLLIENGIIAHAHDEQDIPVHIAANALASARAHVTA